MPPASLPAALSAYFSTLAKAQARVPAGQPNAGQWTAGQKADAMTKLAALPALDHKQAPHVDPKHAIVAHPFDFHVEHGTEDQTYQDAATGNAAYQHLYRFLDHPSVHGTVEMVPHAELKTAQPQVYPSVVAKYIQSDTRVDPEHDQLPMVVKYRGALRLEDGHNRIMADHLLGATHSVAHVLDLDAHVAAHPNGLDE